MKDETILDGILEFRAHRNHKGFKYEDSPKTRSFIFTCPECDHIWDIDLSTLGSQLPEVREKVQSLRLHYLGYGRKAIKRADARASKKARALLFRTLTRDQVRQFKKLGYIEVTGTDSRVYRIGDSGFHNVTTEIDGVLHRYCLLSSIKMPTCDMVLAQKLWLERDTEGFLKTANLIEPRGVIEAREPQIEDIEVPEGVEDDPRTWVEEQINAKQEN